MDWQTIDSIPKDGSRFLAGYWDDMNIWRCAVYRWDGEAFYGGSVPNQHIKLYMHTKYTHWSAINPPAR